MKLYEINKAIEDVIENGFSVNEETGELLFTENDLDRLYATFEEKVENTALVIKNYANLVEGMKQEEKNLKARREQVEKKIEYLKGYLGHFLNGEKFTSAKCAISYRKSSFVVVEDIGSLPDKYLRTKTVIEPSKACLKESLNKGEEIKGCHLEEKTNMIII